MATLIGRKKEKEILTRLYNSDKSEFVAVYGRRRVGKTYLINESLGDKITFSHTGISPFDRNKKVTLKEQLGHFYRSLVLQGMEDAVCPDSWLSAFYLLEDFLIKKDDGGRQVVFIDELPWLDTPGSGIITALEAFWNGWAAKKHNIMLIVCGSATSWITNNLVLAKGGLYGRLTYEIKLSPFSLGECEEFFYSKGIEMSRFDIAQAYMMFGGIPFYLNYFEKGMSLAQNIDSIMFDKNARLSLEFERLFGSLFKNPEPYEKVVRLLAKKHCGFSRNDISYAIGVASGKRLTNILSALEASDYIVKYKPFDAQKSEILYRLTDSFCRSYLYFKEEKSVRDDSYWQSELMQGTQNAWLGIAFEELCFNHIKQIKAALGIAGVGSVESAFTLRSDELSAGAQCDLLIIRKDRVVNLCEMKFVNDEFVIDSRYDLTLRHRITALSHFLKKTQTIHLTFVTSFGVANNKYSGIVQKQVTLDDLFA